MATKLAGSTAELKLSVVVPTLPAEPGDRIIC